MNLFLHKTSFPRGFLLFYVCVLARDTVCNVFLKLLACSVYDDDPNPPPVGQMDNPPKHGARNARYRLNSNFRTGWKGHFLNSVTCYILFESFFFFCKRKSPNNARSREADTVTSEHPVADCPGGYRHWIGSRRIFQTRLQGQLITNSW